MKHDGVNIGSDAFVFNAIEIYLTRTVHKVLMRRVLSDKYRITQEKF